MKGKIKTVRMPKDCREVQEAMDRASWDAIEGYRQTGEMVPTVRDGKLAFVTVEEAFSARPDCAERKRADGDWRLKNLVEQFRAAGVELTPDVWDRLEADRRQALADDLTWIARGREGTCLSRPSCHSCQKKKSHE